MQALIIQLVNKFAYIGILLLVALENIFPPIPSEVILTFGGFLTTYTSMKIWGVIIASTIGSMLGAVVLYGVGRILKAERLEQYVDSKWGRTFHFKKEDVKKAVDKFSNKGKSSVFFCRFIPIIRSLISIPAGITNMKMTTFLSMTAAGTFIWNAILVNLGALAGNSWGKIVAYVNTYAIIAAFAIILVIIIYKKRFSKKVND